MGLSEFSQNVITNKNKFSEIFIFFGVEVILFILRTVTKHKIQLLPNKVCAILLTKCFLQFEIPRSLILAPNLHIKGALPNLSQK